MRIKEERERLGIKQTPFAKRIGISQPALSDLENGISKSSTYLPTIAKELGVSAYWLETGKGPKTPSSNAGWPFSIGHDEYMRIDESARKVFDAQISLLEASIKEAYEQSQMRAKESGNPDAA